MDPNNVQQPQAPLDPSVVALTKAIGMAESGGKYNAPPGDKGSLPSAYQFTPGFVDKWGPSILGPTYQPGQQLNPAQQDQLAYGAVKTMGTTGDPGYEYLGKLSPAQVASAWNAGDPNAYLDPTYGKNNAYGSTENYVKQVEQHYNNNMSQQTASNPLVSSAQASSGPPPAQNSGDLGSALNKAFNPFDTEPGGIIDTITKNPSAAIAGAAAPFVGPVLSLLGLGGGGIAKTVLTGAAGVGVADDATNIYKTLMGGASPTPGSDPSQPTPSMSSEMQALLGQAANSAKASKTLTDTTMQALGTTVGGANMAKDPFIQEAAGVMGHYGYAPTQDSFGRMDYTGAYQDAGSHIGELSKATSEMLAEEGGSANAKDIAETAKADLRQHASSEHWAEGNKVIDDTVETYRKNFGDKHGNIPLQHVERMRKELGPTAKFDKTASNAKIAARKALYHGARRNIEKKTKNKELYNAVMKHEQQLINARKIMKRLNGKKSPENKALLPDLLRQAGKLAAGYLGDQIGGPIGAVMGYMTGRYIINAIDKKYGNSIFQTPAMKKALKILGQKSPAALRAIEAEIAQANETSKKNKKVSTLNPIIQVPPSKPKNGKNAVKGGKPKLKGKKK